ncbi:MAG: hypothetical protein QM287_05105 [Bacillota bacterium]|jgi:hypothetical protein|nr:hypothetical protein [Bacillota bacterium]
MGIWILRIIGYYILNVIISIGLMVLYGQFDPTAGYFLLILPVTAAIATVMMLGIKYKFPKLHPVVFFLLAPVANVLSVFLLFGLMILENRL